MKVANLDMEDAFAWGVSQKIWLTGNREISFKELETFARFVREESFKKFDIKTNFSFSRNLTYQFLKKYKNYVSLNAKKDAIKLNDGISFEDCLDIFHMGLLPQELTKIMLDKNIGKNVFKISSNVEIQK